MNWLSTVMTCGSSRDGGSSVGALCPRSEDLIGDVVGISEFLLELYFFLLAGISNLATSRRRTTIEQQNEQWRTRDFSERC
jgi:hypothetical protein